MINDDAAADDDNDDDEGRKHWKRLSFLKSPLEQWTPSTPITSDYGRSPAPLKWKSTFKLQALNFYTCIYHVRTLNDWIPEKDSCVENI